MIEPDLRAFLEGGLGIHIGSRTAALEPNGARALAVKVEEDRLHLVVYLPEAAASRVFPISGQQRRRGRCSRGRSTSAPAKSRASSSTPACGGRRARVIEQQWDGFRDNLERIGIPRIGAGGGSRGRRWRSGFAPPRSSSRPPDPRLARWSCRGRRNKNPQLRLRALQEIAASKDAEAFDRALDFVEGWPRDDKREGVKVVLQALAEKKIGRRDQANNWIWRCANLTREVHEEYAVQRWPETKRLLGLLVNSSAGRTPATRAGSCTPPASRTGGCPPRCWPPRSRTPPRPARSSTARARACRASRPRSPASCCATSRRARAASARRGAVAARRAPGRARSSAVADGGDAEEALAGEDEPARARPSGEPRPRRRRGALAPLAQGPSTRIAAMPRRRSASRGGRTAEARRRRGRGQAQAQARAALAREEGRGAGAGAARRRAGAAASAAEPRQAQAGAALARRRRPRGTGAERAPPPSGRGRGEARSPSARPRSRRRRSRRGRRDAAPRSRPATRAASPRAQARRASRPRRREPARGRDGARSRRRRGRGRRRSGLSAGRRPERPLRRSAPMGRPPSG